MNTFGISPHTANRNNEGILREVRANRLEKRLREARIRRELMTSDDPRRGIEGPYEAVYANVEHPVGSSTPKEDRGSPARGGAVLSRHWGRGWWAW